MERTINTINRAQQPVMQLWAKLENQEITTKYLDDMRNTLGFIPLEQGSVRVFCTELEEILPRLHNRTAMDVLVNPGCEFSISPNAQREAFLLPVEGAMVVGGTPVCTPVHFDAGNPVRVAAPSDQAARFVYVA